MAHKASISGHRPSPLTTAGRDRWQTVGFDLGHYCLISLCWLRLIYNNNKKSPHICVALQGHCESLVYGLFLPRLGKFSQ